MKENETREKIKMEIDRYHFIFGFDNMIAIFVPCNTMHITQNSEDYRLAYTFEHTCSSIEDALMDLRVFVSTGNGKLRLNNVVGIKINGSIYCFRYLGNRKENLSVMENYQEITRFTDKEKKSLIDSIHRENKVMDVLSGETIKIENVVISDNTFYAIDGENFKPVGNYEKGFTTTDYFLYMLENTEISKVNPYTMPFFNIGVALYYFLHSKSKKNKKKKPILLLNRSELEMIRDFCQLNQLIG